MDDEVGIKAEIMQAVPASKCGACDATGVRLYRPYGEFRREVRDRCNACVNKATIQYYVPLIFDSDGMAWGFSSALCEDIARWMAQPEKTRRKGSFTWVGSSWISTPVESKDRTVISGEHVRTHMEYNKLPTATGGEFNLVQDRDKRDKDNYERL